MSQRGDLALLVVDIDRWGSPVAEQFSLNSIPAFIIYDANGKVIASGEAARSYVARLLR